MNLPPAVPKPCSDCPWRRNAIPGWLGPHKPETWIEIAHSETPVACHQTIPHESEGWDDPRVRQCAGMAIYRNNVAKMSIDRTAADHFFDEDHVAVFSTDQEFIAYHRSAKHHMWEEADGD